MLRKILSSNSETPGETGSREIFTSNLSVNEFLLLQEAGFEPVGMVMGSSVYYIRYPTGRLYQNQEIKALSDTMYKARDQAVQEMQKEASKLKAHGIVGVSLEISQHELGEEMAEFVAIGTAIRSLNRQSYLENRKLPFTSDLSGQDFWTLLQAGYRPVGMVMGSCVYYVYRQGISQWFSQFGRNVEMSNYTNAFYDARELAMSRMQAEATKLKADGIVGMQIHKQSHSWETDVMEFFAIGTAIKALPVSKNKAFTASSVLLND